MRILFFNPYSLRTGGGGDRATMEMACRLSSRGHDVEILATQSSGDEPFRISPTFLASRLDSSRTRYEEIPSWNLPPFGKPGIPTIQGIGRILRHVRMANVAIVAVSYIIEALSVGSQLCTHRPLVGWWGIPIVHHGSITWKDRLHNFYMMGFSRFLCLPMNAHVVNNVTDAERLKHAGLQNVHVIPVGVDTSRFHPDWSKWRELAYERPFRVAFVGRLTYQKGVDVLCEVIEHVDEDIEFWVAGTGPLLPRLREVADRTGCVRILGFVSDTALPQFYRACNIAVVPSRWETLGMVALEAQASGLPTIASRINGLADVVKDGVTGSLVDPESCGALVNEICRFESLWRDDREAFLRMRETAVSRVAAMFSWERSVLQFESVLYDIMEDTR